MGLEPEKRVALNTSVLAGAGVWILLRSFFGFERVATEGFFMRALSQTDFLLAMSIRAFPGSAVSASPVRWRTLGRGLQWSLGWAEARIWSPSCCKTAGGTASEWAAFATSAPNSDAVFSLLLSQGTIGAGADSELGAKRSVEVGDVAKAASERDVQDFRSLRAQASCSTPQPHSEQVLMRRCPRHRFENSKKVIRRQARNLCEAGEVARNLQIVLDGSDNPRNARQRTRFRTCRPRLTAAFKLKRLRQRSDAKLLKWRLIVKWIGAGEDLWSSCDKRREVAHRRQARRSKTGSAGAFRDLLAKLLTVRKRQAPVALAVLVSAREAITGVAEQQGTGRHQFAAGWGLVLKRATDHNSDRGARMLLFIGPVPRSGRANYFRNGPAVSGCEWTALRRYGRICHSCQYG